MRILDYLIAFLLIFIIIMNYTPTPLLLGCKPIINRYVYVMDDGTKLVEYPEKGGNVDFTQQGLKRTFSMNPLQVSMWREYFTHPRWKLDYHKP